MHVSDSPCGTTLHSKGEEHHSELSDVHHPGIKRKASQASQRGKKSNCLL